MPASGYVRIAPWPAATPEQQATIATELTALLPVRLNKSRIATDLARQTLVPIDPAVEYLAVERALPREHAPRTEDQLCREHRETITFLSKQLKKDPKSPPKASFKVNVDHLNSCLGCENMRRVHATLAMFLGTFAFAMTMLRSVRSGECMW